MNIGIVCYPTFGGSGVVATELGMELSRRGHNIHFITYKQPVRLEQLSPNIHFHEVNVPEYPLFHYQPYELALSSKLVNVIKKEKLDLLHVHYAIPHAYAGYMAKKMLEDEGIKIPMVTTLHGTDITLVGNHPFYKPAVTFSINHSNVVTSVSKSLREDTYRLFDVKKEIKVIPNFIDVKKRIDKAKSEIRECLIQRKAIAADDERIITHISNFRKVKRTDDVIRIFNEIRKKMRAKLLLVGEGPEISSAKKLAVKFGISDDILFMGASHEINKILCLSDLFLLPSATESFGLAALEAMTNAVPVISTNAGGLPEVNEDGISGFLSPVGDIKEMSKNAIYILEDDNRLRDFKRTAQEVALKFDIEEILPYYEEIYAEALLNNHKQKHSL
ncbi:MAG TPA: N-acetyl-alpha-D-glucosaminyl L-malate synthase BshA [Flavobacteriaceae bacterium]|nr:N-acetyl-alpha-D-glucosaminyl L-malate synthase BshA [Flavobacteriaceae bacterium]